MSGEAPVFLDASTLLAAAASPSGGSAAAIALLSVDEQYGAVVSPRVGDEVLRNLRLKFDRVAVVRLYNLLAELRPRVVEPDATLEIGDLPDSVAAKDHHVIRACLAARAAICLTLDRRHLLTDDVRAWGARRGLRFLTPGEFLEERRRHDEAARGGAGG